MATIFEDILTKAGAGDRKVADQAKADTEALKTYVDQRFSFLSSTSGASSTVIYSTTFDDAADNALFTNSPQVSNGVMTVIMGQNTVHAIDPSLWDPGDKWRVSYEIAPGESDFWEPEMGMISSPGNWLIKTDVSPDSSQQQNTSMSYTFTIPTGTNYIDIGWNARGGDISMTSIKIERLSAASGSSTTTTSDPMTAETGMSESSFQVVVQ